MIFTLWAEAHGRDWEGRLIQLLLLHLFHQNLTWTEHTRREHTLRDDLCAILNGCKTKIRASLAAFWHPDYLKEKRMPVLKSVSGDLIGFALIYPMKS